MASETDEDVELAKWYTLARRFPQLIGKTPNGGTIWGGPYTYTQVVIGGGLLLVGAQTIELWGRFGVLGNLAVLGLVVGGAVFGLGRMPLGARNPVWILVGIYRAMAAPSQGRLAGKPVKAPKPRRQRTRITVGLPTGTTPTATRERRPADAPTARVRLTNWMRRTCTALVPGVFRGRRGARLGNRRMARSRPALTGVQQALAQHAGRTKGP